MEVVGGTSKFWRPGNLPTVANEHRRRSRQQFERPPALSHCRLWLEADQITGVAADATFQTWSDLSGLGNDASQSTSANRPTYRASGGPGDKPYVDFSGSPVHMRADGVADDLSGNDTPYSAIAVAKFNATGVAHCIFGLGDTAQATNNHMICGCNTTAFLAQRRDSATASATGGTTDTAWGILVYRFSGTAIELFRNGASVIASTVLNTGSITFNATGIGALVRSGVGSYLAGGIAFLAVYDDSIPESFRFHIERYLARKYQIGLS